MGCLKWMLLLAVFTWCGEFAPSYAAGPADVYAPKSPEQVKSAMQRWLDRRGASDAVRNKVEQILNEGDGSGRALFERTIAGFAAADEPARSFIAAAASPPAGRPKIDSAILTKDESDKFFTMNLRLYYARSLAQNTLYDEALAELEKIDPAEVVDPATCLFHQAVCEHQLLLVDRGLATLARLIDKTQGASPAYSQVAALMRADLDTIKEQELGNIAGKMKDSARRLNLGRGGQRVQKVQEEIVVSLDDVIKKAEQQLSQMMRPSEGENNSNQSMSPADDSRIKGATAPGNVDKKDLRKQGGWGGLPPAEVGRAQQALDKQFPSNYRKAVEEYFKKLADRPGAKERSR